MVNKSGIQVDCLKKFTLPYYRLKELLRTGWVEKLDIENSESVASHTLLMIVIVLFLANKYSYSCNKKLKLIEMVLIHDIAESIVGDITPETMSILKKRQTENKAFEFILKNWLPNTLKEELSSVWNEYKEDNTFDSNLIHMIDKLEMLMQANFYLEHRENVTIEQVASFKKSVISFVNKNCNFEAKSDFKLKSNENRELNEIKEILAYLCK